MCSSRSASPTSMRRHGVGVQTPFTHDTVRTSNGLEAHLAFLRDDHGARSFHAL